MVKSFLKRIKKPSPELLLRYGLLGAASLMLLCSVVATVLSLSNRGQHAEAGDVTAISVKPDEVTAKVVAAKADGGPAKENTDPDASADTNQVLYERTATAVDEFVSKYGKGVETIDKSSVLESIRAKARQHKDAATSADFAQGLAATMEKSLADAKIIKLVELPEEAAKPHAGASAPAPAAEAAPADAEPDAATALPFKVSPIGIVNDVMSTYSRLFAQRLEKREHLHAQAETDDAARKSTALTQVCIAAGSFGAFLLLIILSVIVKIEKNLRASASVSIPAAETVSKTV